MDLIHISQSVRKIRLKQNMTVAQLAEKSGFSKGFISRLENFRITPSLKALNKISEALGIKLSDLFDSETKSPEYIFGNIDNGEELVRDEGNKFGISYFSLAFGKIGRRMDPFMLEYRKSDKERELLMHETDEFFILLEGEVDFCIGEKSNSRRMKKGDTVYLSQNIPHGVTLPDGIEYAKAITIYCENL